MKAAPLLALAILGLTAMSLSAIERPPNGAMPISYPYAVADETAGSEYDRTFPGSAVDVVRPSVPLIAAFEHITKSNELPSSDFVRPIVNGPGTAPPVAVPESGSGIMFLVLGALGMFGLRRKFRAS